MPILEGKKGLIIGIANERSIAWGCAEKMHTEGAELAITYLNKKAEPHVRPLARKVDSPIIMPCDVEEPGELENVYKQIASDWGRLDFVLHSIAYAPKTDLQGRIVDCSRDGFIQAMSVSVYSFIHMAKLAEPLMDNGGCLLAMTYYGAEKVVESYNIMGPVKAALEATGRYMAAELGSKQIRVNTISPGPLNTRAASGIKNFDALLEKAVAKAPEHRLISIEDVGALASFLVSDNAQAITGDTIHVDAGYHIVD